MAWRKSWSNLNIFGVNGDGTCKKRALLPAERSVLDDYLDLAEISPIRGRVCIANNIGYTQEQLSEILKTPLPIIKETERKLLKNGTIEIKSRVVIIKNWKKYQSEYERQKRYRVTSNSYNKKLQKKDTKNPSLSLSLSNTGDREFITSLKNNPAYKHVDIEHELGKMDGWLSTRPGRKKTRRFIVNWLNKIEKPIPPSRRMPS